ncbi:hypothetical protein [Flexivirga alba]|uniref:Uncharacterized protein n=1 Tax=Flexivirga alba TaxID=702742 RepID=A0ABW2ADQ3_9MICO
MTTAVAGLASCSSDPPPRKHVTTSTHQLSLPVSNPTVTHVALSGKWLAYTQASSGVPQDFPNEVVAVDLSDRTSRVVGRSAWPKGQSDWVVTDGDWVFWTDQSIAGADSPRGLRWTIRGLNLRTKKTVTLARNTFDSPVPLPVAGGGKVVWAQQARKGSTSNVLREFVIRAGRTQQLATVPAGWVPDQLAIGRNAAYFDAFTSDGKKSDVWRVASPGATPRRITDTGQARGVTADPTSTITAWSDGSTTSDPSSFTVATNDRPGRTVRSGVEYDLHVGSAFASYITQNAGLRIVPNGSTASRQIATGLAIPCRTSVAANRIAYCTQDPTTGRITVRVDQFGK